MTRTEQRLFFALWSTPEQRAALVEIADKLPDELGRRVAPANLHLTLLFLGGLVSQQCEVMEAAADAIAAPPFTLTFDEFGHWPRPQIIWLGSRTPPAELGTLVQHLRRGASSAGLVIDPRPYAMHLTLYRGARRPPREWPVCAPHHWPATEFVLVESLPGAGGVRYEVRRRWPLKSSFQ